MRGHAPIRAAALLSAVAAGCADDTIVDAWTRLTINVDIDVAALPDGVVPFDVVLQLDSVWDVDVHDATMAAVCAVDDPATATQRFVMVGCSRRGDVRVWLDPVDGDDCYPRPGLSARTPASPPDDALLHEETVFTAWDASYCAGENAVVHATFPES